MNTPLDNAINKMNNGESIATCFCDCLNELISVFGGRDSFKWNIGDLTRISLKDPSMVAIID